MPVDMNLVTPRGRALAAALREMRTRRGMSGRELGKRLGLSHSAISHWETGRRIPSPEETASVLTALGVTGVEKHRLIELARNAGDPNWFSVGWTGISDSLGAVIECERAATSIFCWTPGVVPGLLQTPDYARAMMRDAGKTEEESDNAVLLRVDRKEVLTRTKPLRFHALIGEAALRNSIGGQSVMADQMDYLVEMGKRPHVTVQVLPTEIGCWHAGTAGPFVLYEFPDATPVLYFEHYRSSAFDPDPRDVQAYREAGDKLVELAMDLARTREFLTQLAEEMGSDVQDHVAEVDVQHSR